MQVALLLLSLLSPVLPSCSPVPCPTDTGGPLRFLAVNGTTPHVACPTRYPTQIVFLERRASFQCCAAGFRTVEWFFTPPDYRREKRPAANGTELCIRETSSLDEGLYTCQLTGWDGGKIEKSQRLAVESSARIGDLTNTSFLENCAESRVLRPVLGDNAELACTVRTSTTPGSFLQLRLVKDGARNVSSCFLRPLCLRLEPEKYPDQDVTRSACPEPPSEQDVRLRVILGSTGPEVEVRVDFRDVRTEARWQLVALGGTGPAIAADFRISPHRTLPLWLILSAAAAVSVLVVLSVFLFWLDIRLLFSKKPPSAAQTESLRVVLLSADTAQPITAKLADQLIAHLRRRFAVSSRFHPDFRPPLAGAATTAALVDAGANCLSVVLLDSDSLRSALFVGQLKALQLRPGAFRVYVAMETFRRMRRAEDAELVTRLKTDAQYHPRVRGGGWRPSCWVLRQVRLAMELERRAVLRRPSPGGALEPEAEADNGAKADVERGRGKQKYSTL